MQIRSGPFENNDAKPDGNRQSSYSAARQKLKIVVVGLLWCQSPRGIVISWNRRPVTAHSHTNNRMSLKHLPRRAPDLISTRVLTQFSIGRINLCSTLLELADEAVTSQPDSPKNYSNDQKKQQDNPRGQRPGKSKHAEPSTV